MAERIGSRGWTRRSLLKASAVGTAAAVVAACGATPAPAATSQVAATSAPADATQAPAATAVAGQVTEIEFWCAWGESPEMQELRAIVAEFESKHADIKVNLLVGGPGGGDYNELLLARIAAGNAPDAASLFTPPVGFAARGSLDEIDDLMATADYAKPDKFWMQVLNTCKFRGKTFGLPFSAASYGVFYNVDMVEAAGLPGDRESFPKTFDEMQEWSAKFVQWEGTDLKQAGFLPWSESWVFPVWSGLNGSQWFAAKDEAYSINSAENVALLESWVSWLEDQYHGDIDYVNSLGTWDVADAGNWYKKMTPFGQGGAWNTSYPFMKYDTAGFNWDVAKFPVGPNGSKSVTGFWPNWFVQPVGGKKRQQAFLLNEYFCTVGMPIWYKVVFDTPAWLDFPTDVITQNLVDNVGQEKAQDLHNFFRDYLNDAVEMWTSPIEDFGTDQVNRAVDQVIHKAKAPQEALDEAQSVTQAKLEETLSSL
ncbi:MAG: twin-arginine translocation signal domain-containing protein [Anaerolineae bacterium]